MTTDYREKKIEKIFKKSKGDVNDCLTTTALIIIELKNPV